MKIKPINFILIMERILCVYRNYSSYKKIPRVLVTLRISAGMLLAACNVAIRQYNGFFHRNTELLHYYLSTGNTLILLPLVCLTSSKCRRLVKNMEAQYKYFEQDEKCLCNLDRKQKYFTTLLIIFIIIKYSLFSLSGTVTYVPVNEINLALFYVIQINLFLCDFRYLYEFVVINCFLCVLSKQLNQINKSIDEELAYIIGENINVNKPTVSVRNHIKLLDKWSKAYINIKESSKLFNSTFGLQLSFMFASTILYYIILLYSMTTLSVTGMFPPIQKFVHLSTLFANLLVIYLLSLAAQKTQNNSVIFQQKLTKFLIHNLCVPENRERIQSLLRVVSTRPIRIHTFCSINVDMSLPPSCIALCTSYTIVALQFNKVI